MKTMPKAKSPRLTNARDFFKAADGHRQATELLRPHVNPVGGQKTSSLFFAYYNVLGFSLELYFKAFLSSKGKTADELAKFGHKLNLLFSACKNNGYNVLPILTGSVVEAIGPHFEHLAYRYVPDDRYQYDTINELDRVDVLLRGIHLSMESELA